VLEVIHVRVDDALIAGWRSRVQRAGQRLGWLNGRAVARRHATGASLAISAPSDQLLLATEVNEWALCAALVERDPTGWNCLEALLIHEAAENAAAGAPVDLALQPVIDEAAALARFEQLALLESRPALRALLSAAGERGLSHVIDDTELTLGAGSGGRSFSLGALPDPASIDWTELHGIPTAIVTGSNGKTTTVRILAACARSHGWHVAYNCTDGVFFDDEQLTTGDYSGPDGARLVLRERRAQAAILETARGGILRRGIAVSQVDAAVVTNLSADHYGEYGIHDLAGLADVKLSVAAVVKPNGLLVLNADDAQLRAQAEDLQRRFGQRPPLGWFSVDTTSEFLNSHRQNGGSTCVVDGGRLLLWHAGAEQDLGPISAMPLSMQGVATYNVANMAGAALAAVALGIAPATIAAVLARFGSDIHDNYGRMMRFAVRGVRVLVDYAHNPDGLRGFLNVANHARTAPGRLGLLLGQAGNRSDEDIEELARVAAEFRPDLVVVKENETQLRGRAPGEVPRILRAALVRLGFSDNALRVAANELDAVRHALEWAQPGDVLALPIHSAAARALIVAMLSRLETAE
jgi:cyanophycin synthetase